LGDGFYTDVTPTVFGICFEVRAAEYAETLEKVFRDRIGQADFDRVAEFKDWMTHHPKRHDILCYLSDAKE
jgi:hypothetical protein